MSAASDFVFPQFSKPIIIFVGGFGSGKTEVSVNAAKYLATVEKVDVSIADLDLVNPYFRSREVIEEMNAYGIRTVAPKGGQHYADLPILLPEIKGMIEHPKGKVILDVGGDAQGTKALGSLANVFRPDSYDLLMVLNCLRPQTSDTSTSLKTIARIEQTAKLKFTGLISNTHLIDETTVSIILEGYRTAKEISRNSGLPLKFISAKEDALNSLNKSDIDCAVLPLKRLMLKPWERK